jgi:TonB family protein
MRFVSSGFLLAAALLAGQQVNLPRQSETYSSRRNADPILISRVEPAYTDDARTKGIEGSVLLRFEVTEEGVPENVSVEKKLDPGLDANAAEALKKWKFKPATRSGKPVRVAANAEIDFRLTPDRR